MRAVKHVKNGNWVLISVPMAVVGASPQNRSVAMFWDVGNLSPSLVDQLHGIYVNLRKILEMELENRLRSEIWPKANTGRSIVWSRKDFES